MRILRELLASMVDGLVPNRPAEAGQPPDFAAADTTLWLFEAARLMADALGDTHPFVTDELLLALRDAFDAALRGTRHGIHVTAEGLFAAGSPGDALTWMDARARGAAVTSRAGCPIELSALWAKGCETLARLARAAGDLALADRAEAECQRTRKAFRARFWCAETAYPYDVISEHPGGPGAFHDASLRPNAVIALAVDPDCFTTEQGLEILDRAQALVTRAGLRSLAPDHPAYAGRPGGGATPSDPTAHQGPVWPFLLGFFVRAARRSAAEAHLGPLLQRLVASVAANEAALGQLPELAEGDAPHAPAGCVAQARSVAELLRAVAWDLR